MDISAPVPLSLKIRIYIKDVVFFLNNPTNIIFVMLGSVFVISVFAFGFLVLGQDSTVRKTLDQQQAQNQAHILASQNANNQKLAGFDKTRKSDLANIKFALDKYERSGGLYPQSLDVLIPSYLANIPRDPVTGGGYFYQASLDQNDFEVKAILNNGQDYTLTGR